ncbi:serine-rich single-pass membrane protein 1 isoform X1 [Arvicanthis niloticus]|uniref:serine-rich single-pass membrane protein 1 isoform X1 n=1 Tax=Arvicanthis niloticus TaxID=61156 RepID=UPI0014862C18|nr:serine-rich single-pass membrane protein 1 isoform X1 [Arvicanthis niloticus]
MGDLLSLFWEVDPPPIPLSFPIPSQDAECRKDDSCGTIGSFLLWYFIIILILMFFSRASVWMSESKRDEDSGTSASLSKASKEASCKRQSREGSWDSSLVMKKPKQNQLSTVTDSEVALVSAYLEQRRARRHSQFHRVNQIQQDSDTTECDSEGSNSGASSWKESESDHHPAPANIRRRKSVPRQRDIENYEVRERPCLHCKAMRTSEWLTRHFPPSASVTTPIKGEIQEENLTPGTNTKLSKF